VLRFRNIAGLFGLSAILSFSIVTADDEIPAVEHPNCTFFGPQRNTFINDSLRSIRHALSATTAQVARMLGSGANTRSLSADQPSAQPAPGSVDFYIFNDFQANAITPAPKTTDWEFIRRVTLDLTGRIPKPDQVLTFVSDNSAGKRAKLIDNLLASPEWIDKWTMYFGDQYLNTETRPSTGLRRYAQGRNAFYQWIKDSLTKGKPYNQMVTELIANAGNSHQDGSLNWIINGVVTGGPQQDITDQMTANVAETFLGIAHVNCLLCHNGRGHLDALSLWAKNTTRYQAWQLSSYLSHTSAQRVNYTPDGQTTQIYAYAIADNTKGFTNDYALNTTSGNRPARVAPTGCKSGQPCYYVPPQYIFNGDTPGQNGTYRQSLAGEVTGDFQFARATVNYIWAQFFGRGIVDPPNTFDPARLDPDNPPPDPWTLQPSNPRLLNALAQHFIDGGYNLKSLMREIANSETYQLSSRYDGQWNPAWEPYFARKFVRRLWPEEIHDAIVQSSGSIPVYSVPDFTDKGFPQISFAMQAPDVVGVPVARIVPFLNAFLRGNRDDQKRSSEGSVLQALNLMNDAFIESNVLASGKNAVPLMVQAQKLSNGDLVKTLFLNILSRYPTDDETAKAMSSLQAPDPVQAISDLAWSLYNKVDFVFNY
jgi:hypothetical protein